jgi:hypothetical protein
MQDRRPEISKEVKKERLDLTAKRHTLSRPCSPECICLSGIRVERIRICTYLPNYSSLRIVASRGDISIGLGGIHVSRKNGDVVFDLHCRRHGKSKEWRTMSRLQILLYSAQLRRYKLLVRC